jgi:hypothetical protein
VAAVGSGYLGNTVGWLRVGEVGNQSRNSAADLLQKQPTIFLSSMKGCTLPHLLQRLPAHPAMAGG